jgi:hypothetical protein
MLVIKKRLAPRLPIYYYEAHLFLCIPAEEICTGSRFLPEPS